MTTFIAYIRTSTGTQKNGLQSQLGIIQQFVERDGGELIEVFEEQVSGKSRNRPEFQKAIKLVKKTGGRLLIAKLDRLSRRMSEIASLTESRVPFTICDNPTANELTIHILGAMAAHERQLISERTKAGLAVVKAKGVKLGNPNIQALAASEKTKADKFALSIASSIVAIRDEGISTVRGVMKRLNELDVRTSTGSTWKVATTHSVMKRLDRLGVCV